MKLSRTDRQIIGLRKWKESNYQGIAEYPTGL